MASLHCPFCSSTASQKILKFNMFKKLLVPTDGSDLSIAAAVRAVSLAKLAGARMTVLFVQDVYPYTGIGAANSAGLQAYMAAAQAEGTRHRDGLARPQRRSQGAGPVASARVDLQVIDRREPVDGPERPCVRCTTRWGHGRNPRHHRANSTQQHSVVPCGGRLLARTSGLE